MSATEDLRGAIDRALAAGLHAEEIYGIVAERVAGLQALENPSPPDASRADGEEVVYDQGSLPDGLIDLPTASRKYDVNGSTMRHWVLSGKVSSRGRLKAPARGGGYVVVSEDELVNYINSPRNKGGRPTRFRQ